jgi:hypothetical protein
MYDKESYFDSGEGQLTYLSSEESRRPWDSPDPPVCDYRGDFYPGIKTLKREAQHLYLS